MLVFQPSVVSPCLQRMCAAVLAFSVDLLLSGSTAAQLSRPGCRRCNSDVELAAHGRNVVTADAEVRDRVSQRPVAEHLAHELWHCRV